MQHVVRALVTSLCFASLLPAQSRHVEVGVGLAQPSGALSEEHTIGPLFRGALTFVSANPVWRLRVEGSAASMPERNSVSDQADAGSPLAVLSAMVDLAAGVHQGKVQPFVSVGAGLQRFSRGSSATGTAARAGAGVRVRLDVFTVILEVTPTFALMRSGAISDAWAVQYVPFTLGISF